MAEHTARTGYVKKNNPPKPGQLPPKESRRVNVTDPDSRPVKTRHGFIQGYTAQAAATEGQVIVAAELITGANERNRLEPMATAAEEELAKAGVDERPELLLSCFALVRTYTRTTPTNLISPPSADVGAGPA
jgi:hypothetical protein